MKTGNVSNVEDDDDAFTFYFYTIMVETAEAGWVKDQDICIGTVNVLRQKMITEPTELKINIT